MNKYIQINTGSPEIKTALSDYAYSQGLRLTDFMLHAAFEYMKRRSMKNVPAVLHERITGDKKEL